MSIRVFLALLIAFSLAAIFSLSFFALGLIALLPGGTSAANISAFIEGFPIPVEILTFISISIPIAFAFYLGLVHLIVRPLETIRRAMEVFAKDGKHVELPPLEGVPSEIREFAQVWNDFAGRVEAAHSRDMETSRVKSDFISTAAHQLRTPLTGIRWALEALEKEQLTESQQLLIKSAVGKSHDLVAIVGTLLDISSIESGKYAYKFAESDIQKLIGAVATDFAPAAFQAKVGFRYEPGPEPLFVQIDSERIKWVLNNLIENAIRYTPEGGNVRITSVRMQDRVVVQVHDTGIGIPQQDRNNIFERFYRAGNAITKQNQGNGLGLYIARTIVKDHKGELTFASNQEGVGTTFTLSLPSAR